ncbi:MAG TPA: tetratricopeptide repeat protein [Pseudonocardiaceae bacterium]|nr:tetratricopeptide repeat protein [Pseudonocardiaceae bacterium]
MRVFLSYARDEDSGHREMVARLWEFLRSQGIDAHIDLEAEGQRRDWSLWMADQIRDADHVLVIASPAYRARAQGQTGPLVGRGVQWEARLIRDAFYRNSDRIDRFLPVVVPGQTVEGIPDFLAPAISTVYHVPEFTVAGADSLLRLLTGQPGGTVPPLGRRRVRVGLPPPEATAFVPRRLLDTVHDTAGSGAAVVLTPVLSGTGGVGKTQLAAAHARRFWDDPAVDVIAWINAGSRDTVVSAYLDAAVAVLGADPDQPDRAVLRWLSWLATTDRRWLIVLDDLRLPGDLRGLWPPNRDTGQVVITTRYRGAGLDRPNTTRIPVDVYTPAEAHTYLTERLPDHPAHEVDGLARDLGLLPLALTQAAAYLINNPTTTIAAYRTRLADRSRTLADVVPSPDELPDDHERIITLTWVMSLELAARLARDERAPRTLLELASVLDPTGIPRSLFDTHAVTRLADTDADIDADVVADGLAVLHRLNLITLQPHGIRVHGLVQRATRDLSSQELRPHLVVTAANALMETWPNIPNDPNVEAMFRANAAILAEHAGENLWSDAAHPALIRIGLSLNGVGRPAQAREYYEVLHAHAVAILGPDHRDTLTIRNNVAHSLGEAGDLAGAVAVYHALLADQSRVLGPDDHDTLRTRNNIAHCRAEAGDHAGAVAAMAELLDDLLRVLGPDHAATLRARNSSASWTGEAGDPAGAASALEQVLVDRVRVLGPDSPETLGTRNNLASWRGHAGNVPRAIVEFERLLVDRVRVLGPDHPDTLMTRNNIAFWRGEAGDHAGAVAELERLLADRSRVLGPDHPAALTTRSNLACSRGEAGDLAGAIAALEQVLVDRVRVLGPDHPDTLTTRHNIASTRGRAGDAAGAVADFEQLLGDLLRVCGPDHPHTLSARGGIAFWRDKAGDPAGAVTALEQLLADQLRTLGPDHPDTLLTRNNMAFSAANTGNAAGAVTALAELLADLVRVFGPEHPHTLATRGNLVHWRGQAGDKVHALAETERLLTDRSRVLGPDHPDVLGDRINIAALRSETGDLAGAIAASTDLIRDLTRVLGPDHPTTFLARGNLAHYRGDAGDAEGALADYQRLLLDRARVLGPTHPDTVRTVHNVVAWQAKK